MIHYDKDGSTLVDSNGNKTTIYTPDTYSALELIMGRQEATDVENAQAQDSYLNLLKGAQTQVNNEVTVTPPVKPLQHLISDAGVDSYVPFSPPLPDLTPPPPVTGSTTGGVFTTPSGDPEATARLQIAALYRKFITNASQ